MRGGIDILLKLTIHPVDTSWKIPHLVRSSKHFTIIKKGQSKEYDAPARSEWKCHAVLLIHYLNFSFASNDKNSFIVFI